MRKPYTTPEQEQFRTRVANTRRQLPSTLPGLLPAVVDETVPDDGFGLRLILVVSGGGEVVRHG